LLLASDRQVGAVVGVGSLLCLGLLGGLAARDGGARTLVGAMRVVFWGALAMALTAIIGALMGTNAA
jgi:VIT1/CCC1 family predicted Fe2+/Mn2+ transporter